MFYIMIGTQCLTSYSSQSRNRPFQNYSSNSFFCTGVPQKASLIFFVVVVLNNNLFSLRWAKLHLPHPPCSLQGYGTSQAIQGYSWYQSWSIFKTRMGSQGFLCQHSCWVIAQLHYLWGSPLFQCSLTRLYCLLGAHSYSWETPQEEGTERPDRLQCYHLSLSCCLSP